MKMKIHNNHLITKYGWWIFFNSTSTHISTIKRYSLVTSIHFIFNNFFEFHNHDRTRAQSAARQLICWTRLVTAR